jgi:hypothetical protein
MFLELARDREADFLRHLLDILDRRTHGLMGSLPGSGEPQQERFRLHEA